MTNGIPLGCSLLLPVGTVNCVQTLKALDTMRSVNQELLASNYSRDQPRSAAVMAAGFALDAHAPVEHQTAQALVASTDAIQDELASCVMDLRSVIQVALARAGGQKPNIGQLLGVEAGQGELFVRTIDRYGSRHSLATIPPGNQCRGLCELFVRTNDPYGTLSWTNPCTANRKLRHTY